MKRIYLSAVACAFVISLGVGVVRLGFLDADPSPARAVEIGELAREASPRTGTVESFLTTGSSDEAARTEESRARLNDVDTDQMSKLVHWEGFKYGPVLEVRVGDRTLHKVANHLLIHAEGPVGEKLGPWLEAEAGRSVEDLGAGAYLVSWPGAEASLHAANAEALRKILGDGAVVEPDWIVTRLSEPNDPLFPEQWQHGGIFASEGWTVRSGAPDVIVAVLDTGVRRDHTDLAANLRALPGEVPGTGRDDDGNGFIDDPFGWDFVEENNDPSDLDGHGTHIAGLIAAVGNNAVGVAGVAWNAHLLPVRFLDAQGRGTTSDEIRALDYARASGARIINASFGTGGFSAVARARYAALGETGIWVVAAVGNDGVDTSRFPVYPAGYGFPHVVRVGASTPDGRRAGFSNFGPSSVDLLAPGTSLLSTTMDGGYGRKSGTSQATALVSGALALVLGEYPAASVEEIRERLMERARFAPAATQDAAGGILDLGHALAPGAGRPPMIVQHPQSKIVEIGETLTLEVGTVSSIGTTFTWYRNGQPIPLAQSSTLVLGNFSFAEEGTYTVRVRDRFGEAVSAAAEVYLNRIPPTFVAASRRGLFQQGQALELFAEVAGSQPLSYQWYFEGAPLPGQTQARLRIPAATAANAGAYFLRVTNPFGSIDSDTIVVEADPLGILDWQPVFAAMGDSIIRHGDFYFRTQGGRPFISRDLFVWKPLAQPVGVGGIIAMGYDQGVYWGVEASGRIWRGPSPENLAVFAELHWNLPANSSLAPFFVFGGDYLVVCSGPSRAASHRVNTVTAEVVAVNAPTIFLSRMRFADGAFFVGVNAIHEFRSFDGLAWADVSVEELPVSPLFTHEPTGHVLGVDRTSGHLQVRPPAGSYAPLIHQGKPFLEVPSRWMPVPGGLRLSFEYPDMRRNDVVYDLLTGEMREFPRLPFDPFRFAQLTTSVFSDLQRALRLDEKEWRLFERDTATDYFLFGRFVGTSPEPFRTVFTLGDTAYGFQGTSITALSPHAERLVRTIPHGVQHLLTTPEAVFLTESAYVWEDFSQPGFQSFRLYRFGADESFEEVIPETGLPKQTDLYVERQGFGMAAHRSGGGDRWLSTDGRTWRFEADDGSSRRTFSYGPQGWIMARRFHVGSNRSRLEILRLDGVTGAWETVHTEEAIANASLRIQANPSRTLVIAGAENLFVSENGRDWTRTHSGLGNFGVFPEPHGAYFVVNSEGGEWRASLDGLTWFSSTMAALEPLARSKGIVYNLAREFARETGGIAVGSIPLRLDAPVSQVSPARWTLEAGVPQADRAIRIELWADDQLLEARPVSGSIVPFTIHGQEARARTHRVRVLYDDGWVAASPDLRLTTLAPMGIQETVIPGGPRTPIDPPLRFFSSDSRLYVFRVRENDILVSENGREWESLGTDLPEAFLYRNLFEFGDGYSFLESAGSPWSTLMGALLSPGSPTATEVHRPEPYALGEVSVIQRDNHVYLLDRFGKVFALDATGNWNPSHTIDGWPATPEDPIEIYQFANEHPLAAFRIRLQSGLERDFLTSDLRSLWEAPPIPAGWGSAHALGTIIRRADGRAVRFREAHGGYGPSLQLPFVLDAISPLDASTYIASGEGFRWLVDHTGRAWPFQKLSFGNVDVWRNAFQIALIIENTGEINLYDTHDFDLREVARPTVLTDGGLRLRSFFRLRNNGILSTSQGAALLVRASFEAVGAEGEAIFLGEQLLDVSGRAPGRDYTHVLEWEMPAHVPLGEYRLWLEVNADGAVNEINRTNNAAASPAFSYSPEASLLLAESPFGTVRSEDTQIGLAFGSNVRLEAEPAEGFRFLQWSGTHGGSEALLDLAMDRRHQLQAHFVPVALLEVFPALAPSGPPGWYAEPGSPYIALVTAEWSYHRDWGWFQAGPAAASGAWLWFADHGWLWRLAGVEIYFDPDSGSWWVD